MRGNRIKAGLNLLILAICMVIVATFFHEEVAGLFALSPSGEARFVFIGLFWGGVCGCLGILLTVWGIILQNSSPGRGVPLGPTLIVLAATILLFFFLLYAAFKSPEPPRLRPGETITI